MTDDERKVELLAELLAHRERWVLLLAGASEAIQIAEVTDLLRDLTQLDLLEQTGYDAVLWKALGEMLELLASQATTTLPPGWDAEEGEACGCGIVRGRWGVDGDTWGGTMYVPGGGLPALLIGTHRPARAGGCSP